MEITLGTKRGESRPFWKSALPEEQRMDSAALAGVLDFIRAQNKDLHSILVIRDGAIVLEEYFGGCDSGQKHILNSCTKSIVSALTGIAIDQGLIAGETSRVWDFFPEYADVRADPLKAKIEIRHLLSMTSGIDWPQYGPDNVSDRMGESEDWVRFILARPMAMEPGSQANYSNGDSHLLSAILQKTSGQTALDFAWEHLFQPLGIADVDWWYDPRGINIGSATIYITPRDMAKLGMLYLNEGMWAGKRILSADWVRKSLLSYTQIQISAGWADYGYYWWLYPNLGLVEAWGGAGQRIAVFPRLGIISVMTADLADDAPVTPFSAEIYRRILAAAKG